MNKHLRTSAKYFYAYKCLQTRNISYKKSNFYSTILNNKLTNIGSENIKSKLWFASLLGWLGLSSDGKKESPEDQLITTIKRSILCIQREQYDKAEQMLHLALRMAQDIKSKEGITYIYDVMANLAMEQKQFKKAEALFIDVMRRLLGDGHTDDNPKILHISAKLAHIAEIQGELEKALTGFTWTLKKIEEYVRKVPDDLDIQELWGLTNNWFGYLLLKQEKYEEAKKCFLNAYNCLIEMRGSANEEIVTILNNLSVTCVNMQNFQEAKKYLNEALKIIKKDLRECTQEAILKANLGLIYLREGFLKDARTTCSDAWRLATAQKHKQGIEQAEYCLEQIKSSDNKINHINYNGN